MTLHAARDGKHVRVQCTYGPIVFSVTEDPAHVRHFWGELGRVLDEAEKPDEPAAHDDAATEA